MPLTEWGWEITPDELQSWILQDDEDLTVLNKPALVVCHPSKNGPWSSLVGACREGLGLEKPRLVARLDRETSGIIILAKRHATARELQMALEKRSVSKRYLAIMEGRFEEEALIENSIGKDPDSLVHSKSSVKTSGKRQPAETLFKPLISRENYSLVVVEPHTGRKHQIRVHAQHIGHSIVGDKLYGPDETLFLEFIEHGWTENLEKHLPLNRHALHAFQMTFDVASGKKTFVAPPTQDFTDFCEQRLDLPKEELDSLLSTLQA